MSAGSVRLHLIKFSYDIENIDPEILTRYHQWLDRRLSNKTFLLFGLNQFGESGSNDAVLTSHLPDSELDLLLQTCPLKKSEKAVVEVASFWADTRHQDIPYSAIEIENSVGRDHGKNFWHFSHFDFEIPSAEEVLNIEISSTKEPFHRPGHRTDTSNPEELYEPLPLSEFRQRASFLLSLPKKPIFPDLDWVERAWIGKRKKAWPEILLFGEDATHRICLHYYSTA